MPRFIRRATPRSRTPNAEAQARFRARRDAIPVPAWFEALPPADQDRYLALARLEIAEPEVLHTITADMVPFGPSWLRSTAPASWHWEWRQQLALYPLLNAVHAGEIKFLIVVWPPRHTKTETTTVRFPAYWLEDRPSDHVIVAAHTQRLANRISRRIRRLAPGRFELSTERAAVEEWETRHGGGLRAVGVGVAVAGVGGNLIFIDDPIRSRRDAESEAYRDTLWDWYTNDLYTRREPGAAIVLSMTRWHEDDLVGRILNSEEAPNWVVSHLPAVAMHDDPLNRRPGEALCPDRYDEAALAQIRRVEGAYGFSALYQGMPAPPEGGILKRAWWRFHAPEETRLPPVRIKMPDGSYIEAPLRATPKRFATEVQSWDLAFKDAMENDFVCGQHWGKLGADCFLLDQTYEHRDLPSTIKAMRIWNRNKPAALAKYVEDKANGPAVIQTLRHEVAGMIAVNPVGSKPARAHAVAPSIEAGNVYLPHPATVGSVDGHNWVEDLIENCATVPNATHDDDVDALTQALNRLLLQPGAESSFVLVRAQA